MVLLVGRDLHEAERVRRLLPARVGISPSPSEALEALRVADVLLLEDLAWPSRDAEALEEMRELSAARKLAVILSRRRGELLAGDMMHGDGGLVSHPRFPVVERPYRMEEVVDAMRLALMRRR
ncbi:MAG: hypothetical protein ABR567_09335 [Myxococcales bacterium]|nr:hypothetical protein [Myxococcales bacterium]